MNEKKKRRHVLGRFFNSTIDAVGQVRAIAGRPRNPRNKTVLLEPLVVVDDEDQWLYADNHHWFAFTKLWRRAEIEVGDYVRVTGRVKIYTRGYQGDNPLWPTTIGIEPDYELSNVLKVEVVKPSDEFLQFILDSQA